MNKLFDYWKLCSSCSFNSRWQNPLPFELFGIECMVYTHLGSLGTRIGNCSKQFNFTLTVKMCLKMEWNCLMEWRKAAQYRRQRIMLHIRCRQFELHVAKDVLCRVAKFYAMPVIAAIANICNSPIGKIIYESMIKATKVNFMIWRKKRKRNPEHYLSAYFFSHAFAECHEWTFSISLRNLFHFL